MRRRTILSILIGYLDEVIRPVVLVLPEMSENVKKFKGFKDEGDKNKNNKLMYNKSNKFVYRWWSVIREIAHLD